MNIFWFIALAQIVLIIEVMIAGRVRIRGRTLAEREVEPNKFWFYQAGFSIGLVLIVIEALNPPY